MNRKPFLAAIVISTLLASTLFGVQSVSFANAATYLYRPRISMSIVSPTNASYILYTGMSLTVDLGFNYGTSLPISTQDIFCSYSLDGGNWEDIPLEKVTSRESYGSIIWGQELTSVRCQYRKTLQGLSEGLHFIDVVAYIPGGDSRSSRSDSQVYFVRGSTGVPVLSPQSKTYDTRDIQLFFLANFPTHWVYSLDNQANVTISGNTTLSGLSDGLHSIVIYNDDVVGDVGASRLIQFTVNVTAPTPSNQPTGFLDINLPMTYGYAIVAALVIIFVAGASLLFYFRKRRRHYLKSALALPR